MMNRKWQLMVVLLMAFSVAMSGGCKKKPKAGSGMGSDNVGGVIGGLDGEGALGDRPEGMSEMAGQFSPIYFDYDSAQVNPGEQGKLQAVIDYLNSNGSAGVIVEGNSDERGSNEYNLALGERRALAVRAALIGMGVDASRVQTKSYGEERPAAMGHDDSSWAQNRRADFVLFQ